MTFYFPTPSGYITSLSVCLSACLYVIQKPDSNYLLQVMWHKNDWNTDLSRVHLAESQVTSYHGLKGKCFNKFSHVSKCFHGFEQRTPEVRFEICNWFWLIKLKSWIAMPQILLLLYNKYYFFLFICFISFQVKISSVLN